MSLEPIWRSHYEDGVATEVDTTDHLLTEDLTEAANRYPGHTALHLVLKYLPLGLTLQSKTTYRELDLASNRVAHALRSLGLKAGDRVAIMLPNTPQYVTSLYGILKAGLVVVNANPIYTAPELEHIFSDSNAKAVICMSGGLETVRSIQANTELEHILITDINETLPGLARKLSSRQLTALGHMAEVVYGGGVYNLHLLMSQQTARSMAPAGEPDSLAVLQYTGGTTGQPRAAVLTHRSLGTNTSQTRAWFAKARDGEEVMMGALPFFHIFGLAITVLLSVRIGARIVITPNPRDTEQNLRLVSKEGITVFPGVPALYNAVINHEKVGEYNLSSVDFCISGGAPLPMEVQETFNRLTGGNLVEGYGLTECSPVVAANPLKGEARDGKIGLPFPSTEVRIVNVETDADGNYMDAEPGAEGELCVRGPQLMKEYWQQPEATAETIDKDGWLHTGDIVTMDDDGYLAVVDRKKELILVGGFNVVPREVEEVLYAHPAVLEAAVAGLPDERSGERVKAWVVLHEGQQATEEEIRDYCRKSLTGYKVPREVAFKDELPKSLVGKILRRLLVEAETGQSAA